MSKGVVALSRGRDLPIVAIVGRPNVGKSTFFNKMIGQRRALTHNRPGVTRDRHYGEAEYDGREFVLIDTGGFEPDATRSDVYTQVKDQAVLAIDEADVVLVFFDARQGIVSGDHEIVRMLRSHGKPTLFVVNKADSEAQDLAAYEFYGLGVDSLYPISAEQARGVDEMLDAMIELLPPPQREGAASALSGEELPSAVGGELEDGGGLGLHELRPEEYDSEAEEAATSSDDERQVRIAIVGRPNVGKSSLANRLLGEKRQVIHPEAGTTRDSVDLPFELDGSRYVLIDTAGVRRKARISDKLEQFTVIKAFKAISSCDVALLLVDASEGATSQEKRLAGMIADKGRAVGIVVNKWDMMKGKGISQHDFARELLMDLEHIRYAPVHFLSALTGKGVEGIMGLVERISEQHGKEIGTKDFNEFLQKVTHAHPPPMYRHNPVRLLYGLQVRSRPPTFMIFSNKPEGIRPDYRRYVVNRLRQEYGFVGSPVHLVLRSKKP